VFKTSIIIKNFEIQNMKISKKINIILDVKLLDQNKLFLTQFNRKKLSYVKNVEKCLKFFSLSTSFI